MKIHELNNMTFSEAIEILMEEKDHITTYERLKDFAIHHINEDNLYLAIHILDALHSNYSDYYEYDCTMGTLETPKALRNIKDLRDFCDTSDESIYQIRAHIHSLDGKMDIATVLEERKDGTQTTYIVDYKGVKCAAIFNPYVCEYYVDDVYGIIKEN